MSFEYHMMGSSNIILLIMGITPYSLNAELHRLLQIDRIRLSIRNVDKTMSIKMIERNSASRILAYAILFLNDNILSLLSTHERVIKLGDAFSMLNKSMNSNCVVIQTWTLLNFMDPCYSNTYRVGGARTKQ